MKEDANSEGATALLARFPRAVDDETLYNVPKETIDRFRPIYPYWYEGTELRVVATVADPPLLEPEEGYEADRAAHRCVMDYLERNGISNLDELNEEVFTDFDFLCQGEDPAGVPMDRTVLVVLKQPDYFTAEFVRNLQSCFVRKWPLWRAGICNTIDEPDVTIYDDVVRVGEVLSPPANLDIEIARWQREIRQIRADVLAARERSIRQFRYLKRIVPQLIGDLPEAGLLFVAAFEHEERKDEEVWFRVVALVGDPSRDYLAINPEHTYHSSEYPVSADGKIGKRGGHWGEAPRRILHFVVPKLENPTLVVAEGYFHGSYPKTGPVPDGRQWSYQVAPEALITHEQLTEMEANGEID